MADEKVIKTGPIDLKREAPSRNNKLLAEAAKEYTVGDVLELLKYFVSSFPIEKKKWEEIRNSGGYGTIQAGDIIFSVNHSTGECMKAVIEGELNLGDWILDLSKLVGLSFLIKKDRAAGKEFLKEIQEKVKNGIDKKVI